MWQAFVPATGGGDHGQDEPGMASKKRRRVVATGDGEAVCALYASIVQPGKTSSHVDGSSSRSSTNKRSSREGGAGCRSRGGASPFLPLSPPIRAESLSREIEGGRIPASASAVFGPAPNPTNVSHEFGSRKEEEEEEEEEEGFFCQVCGERVKSVSEDKHSTSTLHIFNQKHRPQERKVQIHESNKGFQLLAGMGWNLDEGLGARKQGRVNPLQTTFKRGTTGLGAGEKLRPRVTHFPSHVPSQAVNAPDGKSDAVRAHESLDRRRRRRHTNRDKSGSGAGGVVVDVARSSSAAAESSSSSWGGFWGQGTQPGSSSRNSGGGALSSGLGGDSSSRKGRRDGRVSWGSGDSNKGEGSFLSRKEREAQTERQQRKERRTRFELLSDVPEEYAALFMS